MANDYIIELLEQREKDNHVDNYQEHELHGNSGKTWLKHRATCSTCFSLYKDLVDSMNLSAKRHSFENRMAEINLGGNPNF
jgi:hypothetical protein